MSSNVPQNRAEHAYRVDKFEVPDQACAEFLEKVRETHDLLCTLPGFLQHFLLEQPIGDGLVKIVTIVEWENAAAIESAQEVVKTYREKTRFNPQDMLARLEIKADLGIYKPIRA